MTPNEHGMVIKKLDRRASTLIKYDTKKLKSKILRQ